jgi:hypothetical protein
MLWNYGNRPALKRHIVELFQKHGVTINDPVCNMIGTTRGATCEFQASAHQVSSLVQGLNLKEVGVESVSKPNMLLKVNQANVGCLACRSFKNVLKMKVFTSGHRPNELRLKSGSAFDYLILFQDLDTDKVCVQVSYSYS